MSVSDNRFWQGRISIGRSASSHSWRGGVLHGTVASSDRVGLRRQVIDDRTSPSTCHSSGMMSFYSSISRSPLVPLVRSGAAGQSSCAAFADPKSRRAGQFRRQLDNARNRSDPSLRAVPAALLRTYSGRPRLPALPSWAKVALHRSCSNCCTNWIRPESRTAPEPSPVSRNKLSHTRRVD